jgi:CheY-like chemotaxis protein
MMTCDYLRGGGFNVVEAADAESALAYLAGGQPVALVFSDVGLKGSMDGFALAREIKSSFPGCEVILTSGHVPDVREEGIAQFLSKPYRLSHVQRMIEKTIMVDL